jgi:zinc/manganese transport system substrate-binding protein
MSLRRILLLPIILAMLVAIGKPASRVQAQGKLKVVATFSILGDLVKNVGGDNIELKMLVGADGDSHTFEPTPADNKTLAEAALIFENGLGFETWLDKLYTASAAKAKRIAVTDGIEALKGEHEKEHDEEHAADSKATPEATKEAEHEEEHEHGESDPHAWHDVKNAIQMVRNIRDALAAADSANAETYKANADRYIKELETLDTFVKQQVESLPKESRKLVTSHDAFGYFAHAYGFEIVGWALPTSTEAADPAAGEVAELIEKIKAAKVKAIFAENVSDMRLITRIAQEAGVKVAPPLYSDALSAPGTDGDTYVKMIRYNVTIIVNALK